MAEKFCSFCGRAKNSTKKLIGSPDGNNFICDACTFTCAEIMREEFKHMKADGTPGTLKLPAPSEIRGMLDEFIIGQDDAKKVLAVAVYNHYKRVNYNTAYEREMNLKRDSKGKKVKSPKAPDDDIQLEKSNILMIGPTGSGKTLLAKTLAKVLDVPFAVADATALTEAGYVGEDVENILLKLIQAADYNIQRAERGIIYIDEIDKISKKGENRSITRDVSGEGVQQALLKIIEGTVASVPPQGGRKHPNQEMLSINTANILFIVGGAFVGLEQIIRSRVGGSSLGFGAAIKPPQSESSEVSDIKSVSPMDLVKFGLIPEFVGRIPVLVGLSAHDRDALVQILTKPKNAIIKQYKKMFSIDNVDLVFDEDAIEHVADMAIELKTGARALRTIMEDCMLDIMYEAPEVKNLSKVTISKKVIEKTDKPRMEYRKLEDIANVDDETEQLSPSEIKVS